MKLINATGLVVQISENNRFRRTSLLASTSDISVVHLAVTLRSSIDLSVLHSLNTVSALLHDAPTPNRYFRIQDQLLELLRSFLPLVLPSVIVTVLVVVVEVIESAYLVRTVIRTVPSSNATVICHRINPFFGVHRRCNRANLFARSRLAVRTSHRLHNNLWIDRVVQRRLRRQRIHVCLEVSVNSQPMHLASANYLLFTDNGNVVLSLASHHARVTSRTLVQIDRHTPLVDLVNLWLVP